VRPHRRPGAARLAAGLVVAAAATSLTAAATATAATDLPDTYAAATRAAVSPNATALRSTIDSRTDQDWFKFSVTRTTRAAVTLGSLPGDYSLAVYDGTGRRIALSAYTGTHFERVFPSVAPGTYYVRVATQGDHSSTKAYSLRFRPLPAGLVTLDQSWVRKRGDQRAVATLFNNSAGWLWIPSVEVTWYDRNRRALRTDFGTMPEEAWIIPPHGAMPFVSFAKAPPAGTASVSVKADSDRIKPAAAKPAIRVSGVTTRYSSSGRYVQVRGTTSTSSDYYVGPIYVELYNTNGVLTNVLVYHVPRTVAAGRPELFDVTLFSPGRPNAVRAYGLPGYGPPVLDLP
jgi:hypothetical protein